MVPLLFIPITDFKTITVPKPSDEPLGGLFGPMLMTSESWTLLLVTAVGLGVVLFVLWLWNRPAARRSETAGAQRWILVDGSNVVHWQDNTPQFAPLLRVVERLQALGYAPGVVFDANAGWKLFGRYMDDDDLAHLLHLPREQVFVVPKGTPADPYLLAVARDHKARIVTNDRYRDWAGDHPEVLEPGLLVRGRWQEAGIVLEGLAEAR